MRSKITLSNHTLFIIVFICFITLILSPPSLYAQEPDDDDAVEVFWDDEEPDEEEYEDDEYLDDDEYYDDEEYYDEDEYYEDEEYYDEDEYYEDDEYDDEEYEEDEEDEISDEDLADMAKKMGYSVSVAGSSPGFVNHPLMTYNSDIDYRLCVEFPLLLQMGSVRFRFGAEIGTFNFENYRPVGGKYSGITAVGVLSFPAGPGQVKIGTGMIGDYFGIVAENSYGFAIRNAVDFRFGIRSTTAISVVDTKKNNLGTTSWADGFIMFGFNL